MVELENGKRKIWIDYFDLIDALKKSGCLLCRRVNELSWKFLNDLYYERVLDVGTRTSLRKAKGFCNWHAWMSTEIPNSDSGIAIIYKDLLDAEIKTLSRWEEAKGLTEKKKRLKLKKKDPLRFLYSWEEKASCPICLFVKEHEQFEIGTFLDFIDEESFSKEYENSFGICLRHLIRIIEGFGEHPNLSLLIEKQLRKYRSLSNELEEFIRKLDYRFSKEPKGSEVDSWKRVIEQFIGKREIFGNEMDDKE